MDDHRSWLRLGEAYSRSGRPVAALKALTRAHELAPDDWICLFFIGDVYRLTAQYTLANDMYESILTERPEETGVLLALAESHLALGMQQFATGFLARSEESFSSSIAIALKVVATSTGFRRVAWKTVANALFEASKTTDYTNPNTIGSAVAEVIQLLTDDTRLGASYKVGNRSLTDLASRDAALDGPGVLLVALATYEYRVRLSEDLEPVHKSAAIFDVAIALYPASIHNLILESDKSGFASRSQDMLKEALHGDPSNDYYWNALGISHFDTDPKIAQHCYIKALEFDSKVGSRLSWSGSTCLVPHRAPSTGPTWAYFTCITAT